jgi:hypothetical protein
MMDLEEPSEDESESVSFIKGCWPQETKAGVVCDDLHARDESLLPATLSIFFSFLLLFGISPTRE